MNAHDGGPAFPSAGVITAERIAFEGMSLRDWFAGQALAGWCGSSITIGGEALNSSTEHAAAMAITSYRFADAMLAERNREEGK